MCLSPKCPAEIPKRESCCYTACVAHRFKGRWSKLNSNHMCVHAVQSLHHSVHHVVREGGIAKGWQTTRGWVIHHPHERHLCPSDAAGSVNMSRFGVRWPAKMPRPRLILRPIILDLVLGDRHAHDAPVEKLLHTAREYADAIVLVSTGGI